MGKGQPEAPCGCTVETSMLGVGLSSQELARPSLPWGPFLRPQTRWVPSTLHLSVTQPCTEHLPPLSLHHTGLQIFLAQQVLSKYTPAQGTCCS